MKTEFAVAAGAILLFAAGDTLAAAWGKTGRWWWLLAMLVAGNLAWFLFAYLNKTMPLASASGTVNLGLVVLSIIAGWAFFGERLQPLEKVALGIGLVALALFAYARATAPTVDSSPGAPAADPNPEVASCTTSTSPPSTPASTFGLTTPDRSPTTSGPSSTPP